MSIEWREYDIRVRSTPGRLVDVGLRGALQYSRSNSGRGLQAQVEEGTPEYQHVFALCDGVRDAVLALDDYLGGLEAR